MFFFFAAGSREKNMKTRQLLCHYGSSYFVKTLVGLIKIKLLFDTLSLKLPNLLVVTLLFIGT